MPLILTGVGRYSTTYLDAKGTECRVTIRYGQDAETLGLPSEVLESLKELSRKAGHKTVPYFTEVGKKDKAEPARPAQVTPIAEKTEELKRATTAADMNRSIQPPPVLPDSVVRVEEHDKVTKDEKTPVEREAMTPMAEAEEPKAVAEAEPKVEKEAPKAETAKSEKKEETKKSTGKKKGSGKKKASEKKTDSEG